MLNMNGNLRTYIFAVVVVLAGLHAPAEAGSDFERDRKAILSMAGSFKVAFDFRETVGFAPDYKLHEPHRSTATEWVTVAEDAGNRIVLQHILAVGDRAVKHWRQEWAYENEVLFEFKGNDRWEPRRLAKQEAAGTWTQRVCQTDDGPRYESFGKWVHAGNLTYWQSAETWRPLPRREHTSRSDYDVLVGRNRHTLTGSGWVHEQDNYKLKTAAGPDRNTVVAREIGINRYERTDDAETTVAQAYWEEHKAFWADVRAVWAERFSENTPLQLRQDVEGARLSRQLSECAKGLRAAGAHDRAVAQRRIREIIGHFVVRG